MKQSMTSAVFAVLLATTCSGCVNHSFRAVVGKFGNETEKAMADQSNELGQVQQSEGERIRSAIVEARTSLRMSRTCGLVPANESEIFAPCSIMAYDPSANNSAPVERVFDVSNTINLQNTLADYGEKLALLSQSAAEDNEAFAEAATELATSVGKLDGAIAVISKGGRATNDEKLGLVANVVSKVASYIFAYQRTSALKRIIRETDPIVQEALTLLQTADQHIGQFLSVKATLHSQDLMAAYNQLNAASGSTVSQRQDAVNAFFASVDALNLMTNRNPKFAALGGVHSALAVASQPNAPRADLKAAMQALIEWENTPQEVTQ